MWHWESTERFRQLCPRYAINTRRSGFHFAATPPTHVEVDFVSADVKTFLNACFSSCESGYLSQQATLLNYLKCRETRSGTCSASCPST
jgi:hypothetical protein